MSSSKVEGRACHELCYGGGRQARPAVSRRARRWTRPERLGSGAGAPRDWWGGQRARAGASTIEHGKAGSASEQAVGAHDRARSTNEASLGSLVNTSRGGCDSQSPGRSSRFPVPATPAPVCRRPPAPTRHAPSTSPARQSALHVPRPVLGLNEEALVIWLLSLMFIGQ